MSANTMMGPGDHEDAAKEALYNQDYAGAQVLAVLALAAAVNRLAEAQEAIANA